MTNGSFDKAPQMNAWELTWWFDAFLAKWSSDDANGSPLSGSVILSDPGGGESGENLAIRYFEGIPIIDTEVALEASRTYEVRARYRVPPGRQAGVGQAAVWLTWGRLSCGSGTEQQLFTFPVEPGDWTTASARFRTPDTIACGQLYLGVVKQPVPAELAVQFDDVSVRAVEEHVYLGPGIAHTHGVDGAYRTNLELVNAGAETATAQVLLFDANGVAVGAPLSRTVAPGQRVGVTAALPPGLPSAFAEIHVSPPGARVIAFGSVIDGSSNDPTTVPVTAMKPVAP